MYFSKSTGGFYDPAINLDAIPSDAVEISDEEYLKLMGGQAAGKLIISGDDGYPVQCEPVLPTYVNQRAAEYPPIADQLDMQFKDALNGTTTWVDAIAAVKERYPKI